MRRTDVARTAVLSEKMSSLLMARSPPGMSRRAGRPPTATMMRRAVISVALPFLSVVCGGANALLVMRESVASVQSEVGYSR